MWNVRRRQCNVVAGYDPKSQVGSALGGAILDVKTAVAMQDEIEGLDKKFSILLQDEDIQKLLMRKMIELGIK